MVVISSDRLPSDRRCDHRQAQAQACDAKCYMGGNTAAEGSATRKGCRPSSMRTTFAIRETPWSRHNSTPICRKSFAGTVLTSCFVNESNISHSVITFPSCSYLSSLCASTTEQQPPEERRDASGEEKEPGDHRIRLRTQQKIAKQFRCQRSSHLSTMCAWPAIWSSKAGTTSAPYTLRSVSNLRRVSAPGGGAWHGWRGRRCPSLPRTLLHTRARDT